MLGLLSTTAKSSIRPPMVAGPISRNSKFFSLSMELAWSAGAAGVLTPNAPIPTAIARIRLRTFEPRFISFPLRTRPGMLPLLAHFTHHMFPEGQTNPVQLQTRHPVLTFQCTPSSSIPLYPVLGYPTAFIYCMLQINLHSRARTLSALRVLVFLP